TTYSASNRITLNNILFTSARLINSNNSVGNNVKATIELRIYYDNNNLVNSNLVSFAEEVKTHLSSGNINIKELSSAFTGANENLGIPPENINIVSVN